MRRFLPRCLLPALLAAAGPIIAAEPAAQPLIVFAAASLTNALQEIGDDFTRASGVPVTFSFAASSALARQIESGARADVFFSADQEWMDYLEQRKLLKDGTRRDVATNRLVLIAPLDSSIRLKIEPGFALAAALGTSRLATGDPESVPVGRYARTALTRLGVWNQMSARLIPADNVRVALAFVARGEAPLGIVYDTDARIEPRVRVVDIFPEDTHPPIAYPVALTTAGRPAAGVFQAYVLSPSGVAVFAKFGFSPATPARTSPAPAPGTP